MQARGQTDLQTLCDSAPELAIVVATGNGQTHSICVICYTSMDSDFTGESRLFRGRWCAIGPCVGVQQAGTALRNPHKAEPFEPEPPVIRTLLGKQQEEKTDTATKSSPQVEKSFGSGSFHRSSSEVIQQTASSSASPPHPPLSSSFRVDLHQKAKSDKSREPIGGLSRIRQQSLNAPEYK